MTRCSRVASQAAPNAIARPNSTVSISAIRKAASSVIVSNSSRRWDITLTLRNLGKQGNPGRSAREEERLRRLIVFHGEQETQSRKHEAPSVTQRIEVHPRLWSVVVFHGKDRRGVGLYATKAQTEAPAAALGLRTPAP